MPRAVSGGRIAEAPGEARRHASPPARKLFHPSMRPTRPRTRDQAAARARRGQGQPRRSPDRRSARKSSPCIQAQLDAAKASMTLPPCRGVERRRTMVKANIVGAEQVDEAESALLRRSRPYRPNTPRSLAAREAARAHDQIAAAEHAVTEARSVPWPRRNGRSISARSRPPRDGRNRGRLFPPGRRGECRRGRCCQLLPPPQSECRASTCREPDSGRYTIGQKVAHRLRRLRAGSTATHQLHRRHGRVHPAGDLLPRRAAPSWCSWSRRGPTTRRRAASRPAVDASCNERCQ